MPPTLRPLSERPSSGETEDRDLRPTETVVKGQGPRIARDRMLDFFSDSFFHSAYELEKSEAFGNGLWMALMGELVAEYGYAFARKRNSFVMRTRGVSERPQDLAELFAGVDARYEEDLNPEAMRDLAMVQRSARQNGTSVSEKETRVVDFGYEREAGADDVDGDEVFGSGPGFDVEEPEVPLPAEDNRAFLSVGAQECILPAREMLTSTYAILAKKRSGKSYLAMVIAEELLRLKLPFAVLDPTGAWYGLAFLANGKPSPWEVIVLGGHHGSGNRSGPYFLDPHKGAEIANLVVGLWPKPVVLDLSAMLPEDQHRFVADFGNEIYLINKFPLHIFIDEADEFAPQMPEQAYKFQRKCLNVVDRLVRRGGVKGLGSTVITQRPAVINKNLLSQNDGIFVLRMVAPQDLLAIETWLKPAVSSPSDLRSCLDAIPRLVRGDVYFMQNGDSRHPLTRFMVRLKETFDSGRTPTMEDDPNAAKPEFGELSVEVRERLRVVFENSELADDDSSS